MPLGEIYLKVVYLWQKKLLKSNVHSSGGTVPLAKMVAMPPIKSFWVVLYLVNSSNIHGNFFLQ